MARALRTETSTPKKYNLGCTVTLVPWIPGLESQPQNTLTIVTLFLPALLGCQHCLGAKTSWGQPMTNIYDHEYLSMAGL